MKSSNIVCATYDPRLIELARIAINTKRGSQSGKQKPRKVKMPSFACLKA